jgi:hypothetical protein
MTSARRHVALISGWLILGLLSASTVSGGTVYNFETSNTGPIPFNNNGPVPGWDGWYTPPPYLVPGSVQASVYAYADFPQGLARDPANAGDGEKFLGLIQTPTGSAERAQHGFDFSQAAEWSVTYDLLTANLSQSGNSYDTAYIGGFSVMSTNGGASFTVDDGWDSSTSSTWSSIYWVYDAGGNLLNPNGVSVWTGLSQNHWYSESTVFDRSSNRILFVSITDLTTSSTSTFSPGGWYMSGGAGAQFGANAFRFAGFGPTNALLVDNVSLNAAPEPATLFLMGLGCIALIAFRRR